MMKRLVIVMLVLGLAAGGLFLGRDLIRGERVVVTLVPGRSAWEHAKTLSRLGFGSEAEILALVADEAFARSLGLPLRPRPPRGDGVTDTWLEGFIHPETYHIAKGATPREVLERTASQFRKVWSDLKGRHAASIARLEAEYGLTEADLIVLASLVEEEMATNEEAPTIAGVFLNRIARKMRLETDPTLMYRPDRVGQKPSPVERRDASNPYNTYAIKGLPPGPICSPGRHALEGVLAAEAHDYLFFVARRDGSRRHAFARTLEEHELNIDRYLRKRTPAE